MWAARRADEPLANERVSEGTAPPVRVGVVGVAGMGLAHCFAAKTMPEYDFVAVCDVVEEVRARVARDFEVKAFADATSLFESGAIDAVVLATPPFTHESLVRDALARGLHVYCEKPFVVDAADGDALAVAARDAQRVVQVGFQYRFQPSYARARALVEDGSVGAIFRASLVATNWFRPQSYFAAAPWRGTWARAGGGVLMNQAIHQVDALLWFLGPPRRVAATAGRVRHDIEVEDEASAVLEFADGGSATLVASTIDPVGFDRIELHGERCSLLMDGAGLRVATFDGPAQRLSDESTAHFDRVPVTWETIPVAEPSESGFEMIVECHRDFTTAIVQGTPVRNPPVAATRAVELANAVYLSAVSDAPVALPLEDGKYRPVYDSLCSGAAALSSRRKEG